MDMVDPMRIIRISRSVETRQDRLRLGRREQRTISTRQPMPPPHVDELAHAASLNVS